MVQATQSFRQVRLVVCIALDEIMFWRGPCLPLYCLEGQGYMEILVEYYRRSPSHCLSGSFLLFD